MNAVRLRPPILLLALLLAPLLAGCGGSAPAASPTAQAAAEAPTAAPAAEQAPASSAPPAVKNDPNRKIIKDATLALEVASIDLALSRISGAAAQVGGYVLETRTEQVGPERKQAMLKLAV